MSQVSQATIPLTTQVRRPRRALWLGALLGLAAIATVVLVLALQGDSPETAGTADVKVQPSARADGGPEESAVAASIGRPTPEVLTRPDESRIAAAIGGSNSPSSTGASKAAADTGWRSSYQPVPPSKTNNRPDESRIAAAISGR